MTFLQTESNHDTALTLACAGGHEELVQTLLERGASIEHRDKKGKAYPCVLFSVLCGKTFRKFNITSEPQFDT